MPSWPPSVFTFADAPLASVYAPAAASVVYVGVVLCLNWYMQSVRKGIGVEGPVMRFVQAAHIRSAGATRSSSFGARFTQGHRQ